MNLLEIANRFPPAACRYLARKDRGHFPMSHADISKVSGLCIDTVARLSVKRSWKGIPIDQVVAFSSACGVDLHNPKKALRYIREGKRAHLKKVTPAQKKFFLKLFQRT